MTNINMKKQFSTQSISDHYRSLWERHGDSTHAVQYSDDQSHHARFDILCSIASPVTSILDVGCGLAHLYRYLKLNGFNGQYKGIDIVPEFVEAAKTHCKDDPNADVMLCNSTDKLPSGYDYAMLSGVFNNRMPDNKAFMKATLRRMFSVAEKGIAFNAMSTFVDYEDNTLYYSDPLEVLAFCKTVLGGHPILRHDYTLTENGFPFEYAIYVYKEPNFKTSCLGYGH
ncbi:class I SAM-dependent methyltransferase [Granulosicoccus sp.]|nr:class I SAM-dependent methyltransferase [Granulosicoccus sp.]